MPSRMPWHCARPSGASNRLSRCSTSARWRPTCATHRSCRLTWALSATAGAVAALLAMIGVYGVISSTVIMRRRELGIRLAIGARPQTLLGMVVRQGVTLAFIGTAVGLLTASVVTRFAASLLYDVKPTDPLTFAAVAGFLMAVALVACALPARAAARVNPVDALRAE